MHESPNSALFPAGFVWGVATSAYQIEGSPLADGAGPSNWHRFAHSPGRVRNGDTGDVACDHYRRYREDVALMRDLGVGAYRFSLAWSRILPLGTGRPNPTGLDFYSRLVDELLGSGIRPFVTVFHWDMPAALEDRGGWVNPDSAHWFGEYAEVAFRALSDRVERWITLNEPWVVADAGYLHGVNAPGHRSAREAVLASRHLLLGHGEAVARFRAAGRGQIGLTVNLEPQEAHSEDPADAAAAERADLYVNRQYLDPVLLGSAAEGMEELFGDAWVEPSESELARISQPLDFVGVNYYTRRVVRHDDEVYPTRARPVRVPGATYSDTGWETFPEGLTRILRWVRDRYGDLPLYVTENGAAFPDPVRARGEEVYDPLRTDYYRGHLLAAAQALESGVDLRGYFAWSLLDNFEWSGGYAYRFGLYHVDFETQKRTPKSSARLYREAVRSSGANLRRPLNR